MTRISVISWTILLCASLSLFAQSTQQKDKPMTPSGLDRAEQFEDAHKSLLTPQSDKSKDVGRFTEQVAKPAPGASSGAEMVRKNFIDDHIFGRIEKDGIPHADLSSDEEFIRRVYLDSQGLLPTADAVKAFVASKDPEKRDKLIDSLIGTEEFAEQWAWFWGDLFRTMGYSGPKNAFQFYTKEWLKLDRPYNETVADMITSVSKGHASVPQLAFLGRILRNSGLKGRTPTDWYNYSATTNRLDALDEMTVEIGRIFLGINMDCISCHDGAGHLEPINLFLSDRTRKEFSQQSAFLGRLRLLGDYNGQNSDSIMDDLAKGYDTKDDAPWFSESETKFPRTGDTYEPTFILTGEKPRPGANPRKELARMVTTNPQFARATANLIWGKLMTVGFVEPFDGFDLARIDPKNPPPKPWTIQPTNPELLEAIAADFRSHNHSIHHLMKTIMKSAAYQLSSKFSGEWKDAYISYYPRKYVRVMTGAEVIDTVAQATGRPFKFPFSGTEVQRVKQLTDLADVGAGLKDGIKQATGEVVDVASIMGSFFQNNRETPVGIGNKATPLQAMLMMSVPLVNDRVLADKGSQVQQLLESGRTNAQVVDELYLSTLSRWPTDTEKKWALETLGFDKDRTQAAQDLQWTLLNGPEFLLNY